MFTRVVGKKKKKLQLLLLTREQPFHCAATVLNRPQVTTREDEPRPPVNRWRCNVAPSIHLIHRFLL